MMDSYIPKQGDAFASPGGLHVFNGTEWVLAYPYENKVELPFSHLEAWERGKSVLED